MGMTVAMVGQDTIANYADQNTGDTGKADRVGEYERLDGGAGAGQCGAGGLCGCVWFGSRSP